MSQGSGNYINNAELERHIYEYYETNSTESYEKVCSMFFMIAQNLSTYIAKKQKFLIDYHVVQDLISAGTLKAMKEIDKFNKTGDRKNSKAFNFFTTVIKNEMIQELMKEERKRWYRSDEKRETFIQRMKQEKNVDGFINHGF